MSKKAHLGWADIDLTDVAVGETLKVDSVSGPPGTPIQLSFGEGGGGGGSALPVSVVAAAQLQFSDLSSPDGKFLFTDSDLMTISSYDPLGLNPFFDGSALALPLTGFYEITMHASVEAVGASAGFLPAGTALSIRSGNETDLAGPLATVAGWVVDGLVVTATPSTGPLVSESLVYQQMILNIEIPGSPSASPGGYAASGQIRVQYLGPIPA